MAKERLGSPRGRLFVALDLPEGVREALAEWQRRELTDPALRLVPPENLHITLVFLGWQAEKDFERIADAALGRGGRPPPAPEVELLPEPVGRPPGGRPRLYAIEGSAPAVVELQAAVSARLERERLYKPEKRPFWTHLTVARVKPEKGEAGSGGASRGGGEAAGAAAEHVFAFRPTRLVVFRSHLHPSGARYEPMAELELPTAT